MPRTAPYTISDGDHWSALSSVKPHLNYIKPRCKRIHSTYLVAASLALKTAGFRTVMLVARVTPAMTSVWGSE